MNWELCFKYRSLATQAEERGDTLQAARFHRLAASQEKKAKRQDWEDEHHGVFIWGGAPILEPGEY